jgi:hypothetical protein
MRQTKQGQSLIVQRVDGRKNSYQTRSNAMPVLHILKDSRDFVTESDQVIHLSDDTPIALAAVPGLAGKPAVAMRFELPDGRIVIAKTSLMSLALVVDTLRARLEVPYGYHVGYTPDQPDSTVVQQFFSEKGK